MAVKVADAYHRSLCFEDVTIEKAQADFEKVIKSDKPLDLKAVKALSDFMMHRVIGLARKYNKPIQVPTGLQAGDGNII